MKRYFSWFMYLLLLTTWTQAQSQDISLDDYLNAAKVNYPWLREFNNNISIHHLENEKVRAQYYYPKGYINANLMQAPVINGVGYDKAITNGALYAALIGAKMPLLSKPFAENRTKYNNLLAKKSEWEKDSTWHDVKKRISNGYAYCYADQQLLVNAQKQLSVIEEQHQVVQKLAEKGIMKGTDILLLEITVKNRQIQVKEYNDSLINDIYKLNILCGVNTPVSVHFKAPVVKLAESPDSTHFTRQFLLDSMMVRNQQDSFNLKYKPNISVYADAGLNAASLSTAQNNLGFSIGLNLTMTLFDHGQRKINDQQTKIRMNTIQVHRYYDMNKRWQNLKNLFARINSNEQKLEQIKTQIEQYNNLIRIYRREMATGDMSVNDFLVNFRNSLQVEQDLVNQQLQINILINEYNYWNW